MRFIYLTLFLLSILSARESRLEISTSNDSLKQENLFTGLLIRMTMKTIYFYQNYLGKIKGSYCPMYPSCSNYGVEAIKTYSQYSKIIVNESIKFYDPPYIYVQKINNN